MLGMNHGMARLNNVWGEGGGNRPVKYLTRRVSDAVSAVKYPRYLRSQWMHCVNSTAIFYTSQLAITTNGAVKRNAH